MNKLYLLIGVFIVSVGASAQYKESHTVWDRLLWDDKMLNIMLDTRVDMQTKVSDGDLDNLSFHGQTFRLWLVGEIIPGIRYRVRHRFNKPQTPLRDGYGAATDHAWIALDAGSKWTFTVGKQVVQLGTFEWDYNGADLYQPTMVGNDFDGYRVGVDVAYKVKKQTLHLQIMNSGATQFATEEYEDKSLALAFLWVGNLFDDVLKTRWGYSAFQHKKSHIYNWFTLGTQLNVGKFSTELDYYIGRRNIDYGSIVGNSELGNRYVRDQSVGLNFKYNFGKWKPFIKGTWDQRRDQRFGSNAYETFGVQGVVEFYPFTNQYIKDLRFHAMYAYSNTDFQGTFSDQGNKDVHTILIGTRWFFKVK